MHATEVLGAQQLIELQYQMLSRNDPETRRLLNDGILITCLVNPDGMELVSNWYMRDPDPMKRSTGNPPVLYNKYAGHDNNRDFYMVNLSESEAINRILYREFYPVIMYNHHQSGPAGTVMFSPPFRDPFNINFDPLIVSELDEVAAAMHSRFIAEDKPGVTMRSNANYSTWYNGGLRTAIAPFFFVPQPLRLNRGGESPASTFPILRRAFLLALILLAGRSLAAQSEDVKKDLTNKFRGKAVTLRTLSRNDRLRHRELLVRSSNRANRAVTSCK